MSHAQEKEWGEFAPLGGGVKRKRGTAPVEEVRSAERPISRLYGEETTCASLCREKDGQFFLKLGCGIRLAVSRQILADATAVTARSTWASIRIGTESYRLNRAELRKAFHYLEKV